MSWKAELAFRIPKLGVLLQNVAGLGEQPGCLVRPPGPLLSRSAPPSKQDMPATCMRTPESSWSRFAHSHWLLQPHPSGRGPGKQAGGPFGQEILRLQVLSVVWKGTVWILSRHDLGPEDPSCLGLRTSVTVSPKPIPMHSLMSFSRSEGYNGCICSVGLGDPCPGLDLCQNRVSCF